MRVYLDNAATTPVDPEVIKAMLPYFDKKFGNASSLHQFGQEAREALEESRLRIAKKINAEPKEIIFTSGGSESDNLALQGAAFMKKTGQIITSKIEHPAVLGTCAYLKNKCYKVDYVDVDEQGFVDLEQLKNEINRETMIVSIIHANNEIGTIQHLKEIGEICKDKKVIFHTDAVQSFTKVPIDVREMDIDLMALSSHKIHGPKGVGALFVKDSIKLQKQIHGGHHEFDKRAGTENVSGIIGFAKAVELMNDKNIEKMARLRDKLLEGIEKNISDVRLNGPRDKRLCNNLNVSFRFIEGESILLHLDMKGIAVSTGSACSSQSLQPSHVLLAIGLSHEIAHGSIRFSLGKENNEKEIDYVLEELPPIVEKLRAMSPLR